MTGETPTPPHEPLVDGHLDLAFNAIGVGRDLTLPLDDLRAAEQRAAQTAMVTWPELRAAGIDLVFGTLFANPAHRVAMQPDEVPARAARDRPGDVPADEAPAKGAAPGPRVPAGDAPPAVRPRAVPAYHDAAGAHAQAREQLAWYGAMEAAGWAQIIRSVADLADLRARRAADWDAPVGVVMLMEGADPIRSPDELPWWWDQGVRIVGPAWQGTRYAGGTRAPGPLTALGRDLVDAMQQLGMALDVSHLADESLWEVLERYDGPLLASHSNARSLTPTDRHLGDDALRALAERQAVVGLVLGNAFLDQGAARAGPVHLRSVRRHFDHVARLVGAGRVGIGSDLDGGFGAEETPVELTRGADFSRLGGAVPRERRASFLGGAWWAWLERSLPSS
jgi:membrane dipeptidase